MRLGAQVGLGLRDAYEVKRELGGAASQGEEEEGGGWEEEGERTTVHLLSIDHSLPLLCSSPLNPDSYPLLYTSRSTSQRRESSRIPLVSLRSQDPSSGTVRWFRRGSLSDGPRCGARKLLLGSGGLLGARRTGCGEKRACGEGGGLRWWRRVGRSLVGRGGEAGPDLRLWWWGRCSLREGAREGA